MVSQVACGSGRPAYHGASDACGAGLDDIGALTEYGRVEFNGLKDETRL